MVTFPSIPEYLIRSIAESTEPVDLAALNREDWRRLVRYARARRLSGVLHAALNRLAILPGSEILADLSTDAAAAEQRGEQARAELAKITKAFDDAAIPSSALAGTVAALTAY